MLCAKFVTISEVQADCGYTGRLVTWAKHVAVAMLAIFCTKTSVTTGSVVMVIGATTIDSADAVALPGPGHRCAVRGRSLRVCPGTTGAIGRVYATMNPAVLGWRPCRMNTAIMRATATRAVMNQKVSE